MSCTARLALPNILRGVYSGMYVMGVEVGTKWKMYTEMCVSCFKNKHFFMYFLHLVPPFTPPPHYIIMAF